MIDYQRKLHRAVNGFPVVELFPLVYLSDPQGNLSLQREAGALYWKIPGGAFNPEETIRESLQHTILENFGILIESCALLKLYSGSDQSYISDDSAHIYPVYLAFFPTRIRGSLRNRPKDGSEMRFFATWNIPMEQIFPPMRKVVQYYIETFPGGMPPQSIDLERFPEVTS